MPVKSFSVLKQQKSEFKQCSIINNQIGKQELESLQLIQNLSSPFCGISQCLTQNCCFIKINEKIIQEPLQDIKCEQIFSELDNNEYYKQTLVYTTMIELKQAVLKVKRSWNRLMMPINEIQVDNQPNETFKLGIITKKFIHHNFKINIKSLCRFTAKVIELDLPFSSSDIIQYHDESIRINPISLLVQRQKQTCYGGLREMLNKVDNCEEVQQILEMLKDFHSQNLSQLISCNVVDKDVYKLKLQLINLLYKRMQM
ncbi:unnamed protein product (macronuclear) [Paramecium tetraurelia]|uniref:Uncharacterized protein n=1 Tax=Paramecium tetraurelia TaxID=5888 RepID=A0BT38_PARTE|nr:uncharacterized protein GSPATT00031937001 [Paramecium tetraurelia]CAK61705.1 unnamed protein product [Paramecium tetraurelia]|eukprot:XP_001429103.1 hypothetical protein (macronuclear) [Paramecium tetraurelia strain d4-2]